MTIKPLLSNPLSDPCNCFYLRRAARATSRQYAKIMGTSGLKATQFSALAILAEIESESITDLADKLGLERTSMSRTLRPLAREDLISVSDEGSRRSKEVKITKAGRQRLQECLPLWRKAQAQFTESLGPEEAATLRSLLRKIASAEKTVDY